MKKTPEPKRSRRWAPRRPAGDTGSLGTRGRNCTAHSGWSVSRASGSGRQNQAAWRVPPAHDGWEASGSAGVGCVPPACPLGRLPSPFSTVPEPWSPFPVTARKGPLLRRGNSTVPRPPLLPDGPTRCPSPGQHGVPLRGPRPLPTFLGRTSPRPPLGGGPVASEHRNPSLSPVLFVAAPLSLA